MLLLMRWEMSLMGARYFFDDEIEDVDPAGEYEDLVGDGDGG